ncbi:hypothetical protein DFH07DRAFT_736322 [Mycena maculata]|uniref:F-box domain-containing protein n=1 Tax=Mycena maculata TaxID=230809 RepID=A0AAD7JNN6_9AGAR|nr:hypothetical protein DFH07DRAFT_736322 [Mycena maculata]
MHQYSESGLAELVSSSGPRLTRLLESNDAPLGTDIPTVRQIISDQQARVDAFNAQIDALQTTMGQLITERDAAAESVRTHSTIISPLRRVPSELICEIFSLTQCTQRIGRETVNCPPWHLAHICRSWRYWTLSDPFLWCSIEISHINGSRSTPPFNVFYPLSMIETQLLWSGNVPLHVSIQWWMVAEGELLDLLLLHCERWCTDCVHVLDKDASLVSRLRDVQGQIPQLQKFQFINGIDFDERHKYLSVPPNLREIILTSIDL